MSGLLRSTQRRLRLAVALTCLFAGFAPGLYPGAAQAGPAPGACRPDTVHLRGAWGQARFRVEVADQPEVRARGLMHRDRLPAGSAMLFVFETTAPVAFWMKNTLIPLDMLFVDAEGRVSHIHRDAVPLDPTPIPSAGAVRYVLEINAGLTRAMGVTVGSELRHPSILQSGAVWPCEAEF